MILKIEMRKCANLVVIIWILMKVHPTSSFSSAKYVWPLTDSTFNFEITTSTPGNYSQCGFHFNGSHPSFSGLPLKLDAYSFPFIDINIGTGNEFKDFSFAMSVHIYGSTGCIFHFKSTTSPGTITDVSVCIDGTTLTMDLLPDPGATAPSHSVPSLQGQWVMIQAGRSQSYSKMKFIVSTTDKNYLIETPESYVSNVKLGLPGILRIGAKHDNSMALSMMVTCITMYTVIINTESDVTSIENQCKNPPTALGRPNTPSTGCPFLLTTQFQTTPQTTNPISTEMTSQSTQTTNHISTEITTPTSQTTNQISTELTSETSQTTNQLSTEMISQTSQTTTSHISTEMTSPSLQATNQISIEMISQTSQTTNQISTEMTSQTLQTTNHISTEMTSQTSQTTNQISTEMTSQTSQTTNQISTEMTTSIQSTSFTTETVLTTEAQSAESTTMAMTTETTTLTAQCNRAELGSSSQKRSGSFILVKENETFNDPSNLIGSVSVGDKKHCAVACFEADDCLSFLYRYNDVEPSPCSLFKTLTPSNGSQMLNSHLYVVKCQ